MLMSELYPAIFEQFAQDIKDNFDLKFYPYEANVLDENFQSPCIYVSKLALPNEGYCGGIDNMEFIFSFSIASRKSDVEAVAATAYVLSKYGKFLDEYDAKVISFDIDGETVELRGDIIDNSPRMQMVDDGVYGAKILDFDYSIEKLKSTNN